MRKLLSMIGVLAGFCLFALALYLETVEYTAQMPVNDLKVVTFSGGRVNDLYLGGVERLERKGDYFELTIDRYSDALKVLIAIAGVVVAMISAIWYKD